MRQRPWAAWMLAALLLVVPGQTRVHAESTTGTQASIKSVTPDQVRRLLGPDAITFNTSSAPFSLANAQLEIVQGTMINGNCALGVKLPVPSTPGVPIGAIEVGRSPSKCEFAVIVGEATNIDTSVVHIPVDSAAAAAVGAGGSVAH